MSKKNTNLYQPEYIVHIEIRSGTADLNDISEILGMSCNEDQSVFCGQRSAVGKHVKVWSETIWKYNVSSSPVEYDLILAVDSLIRSCPSDLADRIKKLPSDADCRFCIGLFPKSTDQVQLSNHVLCWIASNRFALNLSSYAPNFGIPMSQDKNE